MSIRVNAFDSLGSTGSAAFSGVSFASSSRS